MTTVFAITKPWNTWDLKSNHTSYVSNLIPNAYGFRLLPRAIWLSMPLVMGVYLLTNVSYFTVMDIDGLLASSTVAVVKINFIQLASYSA